jgi:hypothetical protein
MVGSTENLDYYYTVNVICVTALLCRQYVHDFDLYRDCYAGEWGPKSDITETESFNVQTGKT